MTKTAVSGKAETCARNFCFAVLLAALALAGHLASPAAEAAEASLSWVQPNSNTDGTPIDLAGYLLYLGNAPGSYQQSVDIGNQTSHTLVGLSEGATYYFAVTAYDTGRNESAFSNEVSKSFPAAPPSYVIPGPGDPAPRDGIFTLAPGKTSPDLTDVQRALMISIGNIAPTASDLAHGDIAPLAAGRPGGDGRIDTYDVIGILRMSVGLL